MNKKLILSSSLVFGFLCQGCSYNSIYEPWFDEDAPLYEEDIIKQEKATQALAQEDTSIEEKTKQEREADTEISLPQSKIEAPNKGEETNKEEESTGLFDWLFSSEEELVSASPEDEYHSQPEIDESSEDIVYDDNITRKEVTIVRPLEKPISKQVTDNKDSQTIDNTLTSPAPKADPTSPVSIMTADKEEENKSPAEETGKVAEHLSEEDEAKIAKDMAKEETATNTEEVIANEEEFIEIPIAVLTNKNSPEETRGEVLRSSDNQSSYSELDTENKTIDAPTPLNISSDPSYPEDGTSFTYDEALIVSAPSLYQERNKSLDRSRANISYEENEDSLDILENKLPTTGPSVSFMVSNIKYNMGSDRLDSKDRAIIEDAATLCKEYDCTIRINAYADTTVAQNAFELSKSRAKNIKQHLQKYGIQDEHIITDFISDEYIGDYAEIFIEY